MTLTLQISDKDFVALDNALKIKQSDFKFHGMTGYARQIITARSALGMSNSDRDCCMDYQSKIDELQIVENASAF